MSAPTVRFVASPAAAEPRTPAADVLTVVMDPAWVAPPGRLDLVAARSLLGAVTARRDVFDEALEILDAWAAANQLPDRLLVEGVTYWFRMRETMWRWLHERLLWADLLAGSGWTNAELDAARSGTPALLDVVGAIDAGAAGPAATAAAPAMAAGLLGRIRRLAGLGLRGGQTAGAGHGRTGGPIVSMLDARLAALAAAASRPIIIPTIPATHQRIGPSGGRARDPNLSPVADSLAGHGQTVLTIGLGIDHTTASGAALVAADPLLVPQSYVRVRWARREDEARAQRAVAAVTGALVDLAGPPLLAADVDLTAAAVAALRSELTRIVHADVHWLARLERMFDDVRPAAAVLSQEGIRLPWLVAGASRDVPVYAVQHGVLYPEHAGYPNRRHPALQLARRTFVFGDYERRVLLLGGAYAESDVEVSGSPRLVLDPGVADRAAADGERTAVRASLGVQDGDRLLVVSTVHLPLLQHAHLLPMLERVLGGPLPGIHVVFKQHPGERDEGPYRALLEALAAAGGYAPPAMTIVKDIDLYALLHAADAHLGLHSTVLTDAVAAGTPNLIAMTDAHSDLLGYVAAGVAHPVVDVETLRAAMANPPMAEPERRDAFLADHFRHGDAGERIAESVLRDIAPVRDAAVSS